MPKCFLTGLEINFDQAWLLNRGQAKRAAQTLRDRLAALDRLIQQLEPLDEVEVYRGPVHGLRTRRDHRLVSRSVVNAYSQSFPDLDLFLSWEMYSKATTQRKTGKAKSRQNPKAGQSNGAKGGQS